MTNFFLLMLFMLFSFSSHAQLHPQPLPLLKKDFLKVASNKYTMAFEYEISADGKLLTRIVEYGAAGLPAVLYEKGTNDNGDSINTVETVFKFDAAGRLIREINVDQVEGTEWTNIYTYAKDGKLVKKQTVTIDPTTTMYTYNTAGKLIKTYTTKRMPAINDDGELTGKAIEKAQQKETYSYDKAGRLKEQLIYNLYYAEDTKNWSSKIKWTYNSNNQPMKKQYINEDGKVYNTDTYQFNGDGLLIKATVQTDDEPLKRFVYEYCITCKQSWIK